VLALVVLAGLSAGVQTVSSLGDGPTDSSAGPTVASAPIAGAGTYVVQPGDTLWSIASALPADGDVREVVAELADRSGGAALRPGQQISLDGLVD
jgi:nucleoid-associated protein YgaU